MASPIKQATTAAPNQNQVTYAFTQFQILTQNQEVLYQQNLALATICSEILGRLKGEVT